MNATLRLCVILSIGVAVWLCLACNRRSAPSTYLQGSLAIPLQTPLLSIRLIDSLDSRLGGHTTIVAQVWKRFIDQGNYRLARASDFRIPQWARQQYHIAPEDIGIPFVSSRMGYAAIVVDTTRSDDQRFGLIIFNVDEGAKEGIRQPVPIYWFYRHKDLSRTVLHGALGSGGLYTMEYDDDGNYHACSIDWDDKKRRYFCAQ